MSVPEEMRGHSRPMKLEKFRPAPASRVQVIYLTDEGKAMSQRSGMLRNEKTWKKVPLPSPLSKISMPIKAEAKTGRRQKRLKASTWIDEANNCLTIARRR